MIARRSFLKGLAACLGAAIAAPVTKVLVEEITEPDFEVVPAEIKVNFQLQTADFDVMEEAMKVMREEIMRAEDEKIFSILEAACVQDGLTIHKPPFPLSYIQTEALKGINV